MTVHLASSSLCSACLQQQPSVRHVDWDAALDGPVVTTVEGYPTVSVEDLILCENCLRPAFELLNIDPQTLAGLEREIELLKSERNAWIDYARQLENTLPARPAGKPKSKQSQGVAA